MQHKRIQGSRLCDLIMFAVEMQHLHALRELNQCKSELVKGGLRSE